MPESPAIAVNRVAEEDYQPIRALNDLLFCPRRCFLHRVEGVWTDNVHTAAGSLDHRRAHAAKTVEETIGRVARGLWVVSHRLRLVGVADVVEFHAAAEGGADVPFPIEYKRGPRRRWDNDDVQLCAQAICLEEMLSVTVPAGAIFHIRSRRRRDVPFTPALRQKTHDAAQRLHALVAQHRAPPPVVHPKCKQCSVQALCLPHLVAGPTAYERSAASLFMAPAS
jgi:CRISPR-associated exonuclease Cas4